MEIMPVTEARFEYNGYPCVVLVMPMGYRCGYVGVPKTHPAYGKDYDELHIDCHGGLTYADDHLYNQDDAETWWLGFDCGHAGDGKDIAATRRYFPACYEKLRKYGYYNSSFLGSRPCSLDYAKVHCRRIAEQLKRMEDV